MFQEQHVSIVLAKPIPNEEIAVIILKSSMYELYVYDIKTSAIMKKSFITEQYVSELSISRKYSEFFFETTSYLEPGKIFRLNVNDLCKPELVLEMNNMKELLKDIEILKDEIYIDDYKLEIDIIGSKNRKEFANPCLLYTYGGHNKTIAKSYDELLIAFAIKMQGIVAIVHVRNDCPIDDMIIAAKHLNETKKITKPKKMAILGGSHGGMIAAACINKDPEQFGAAVLINATLDMLRFDKFTQGAALYGSYGNPENKDDFEKLNSTSPLHNIRHDASYPPTFITAGANDDVVSPCHSLKYTANFSHLKRIDASVRNKYLLRVYENSGHGKYTPTSKKIDQYGDILTFLYKALNVEAIEYKQEPSVSTESKERYERRKKWAATAKRCQNCSRCQCQTNAEKNLEGLKKGGTAYRKQKTRNQLMRCTLCENCFCSDPNYTPIKLD